MKSQTSSKMGQVGSKTMSLDQILEQPCVHSRCYLFSPIIIKYGQNVCLDEILDELGNGSCRVKNRSPGQILEKLCVCSTGHTFIPIIVKLDQQVCLDEISHKFENGSCLAKKLGH